MVLLLDSNTVIGNAIKRVFNIEQKDNSSALLNKLINLYGEFSSIDTKDIDLFSPEILEKKVLELQPSLIINSAEYGNINEVEYWRESAYNINSFYVKKLAEISAANDIKFVQISTSYIFNGKTDNPYKEDDKPDPISVYGDSKYLGEKFIIESGVEHLIFRLPDLYGPGFTFLNEIIKRAKKFGNINVIKGQYLSPCYSEEGALALLKLITAELSGVFHFSQSRYLTAAEIIEKSLTIYNNYFPAIEYKIIEKNVKEYLVSGERPLFNVLDNNKYIENIDSDFVDWDLSLDNYINKYGATL